MDHLPLTHPHGHRLTHHRAPRRWNEGFPLGNGELGAMLWGGAPVLCLTLDRADWWDLREDRSYLEQPEFSYAELRRMVAEGRFDDVRRVFEERPAVGNAVGPTKVSLGRAELRLPAGAAIELTLDLDRGLVTGRVRCGGQEHALTCFVSRERNVVALALDPWPVGAELRLVPLAEACEALGALGHPAPQRSEADGLHVVTQSIPDGPSCALAWNPAGPKVFLAAETGASPAEAEQRARDTWRAAAAAGCAALQAEHEAAWARFWSSSAVFLPDADAERMWYFGVYLLASCAKRGAIPPGLQGLWAMDGVMPPWRGDYHADMNVQETFWPACGAGHLDLLDAWCDAMLDALAPCQAFTRRYFGTEGTYWVCSTLPGYTLLPSWWTVQSAWSNSGWLAWLAWLRWRYSLDPSWLAATGYPLVAGIFRFYGANLEPGDDGCLHVPLSTSPEYRENLPAAWCADPTIDLALIRRTCAWLIEMEQALGRDELSADAARVRDALPPYALDEHGALALWPGKPLDESHRHPSHLMPIHPAMDLTLDGDDAERATIQASLDRFCALGQWMWAGHTYAQMIGLAAVLGRGGMAHEFLRQLLDHWLAPNGLHFNRDLDHCGMSIYRLTQPLTETPEAALPFTIEVNCGLSQGLCDMLLQGWRDTVRIFAAVPRGWRDVAYRDLLTEGAWRVSAVRLAGRTVWVQVRAGVARRLRLLEPFDGAEVAVTGAELRREGGLFEGDLAAGQEVTLALPGTRLDDGEVLARIGRGGGSRFGLR